MQKCTCFVVLFYAKKLISTAIRPHRRSRNQQFSRKKSSISMISSFVAL